MMLRLLAAAYIAAGASAEPPEPEDDTRLIVSLSVDPSSCNLSQAPTIGFARLVRDYAALRGDCVAVRGWRNGRAVYPSYEAAAAPSRNEVRARRTVGLYGERPQLDPSAAAPHRVAIAGVVGGCEYLPGGSAGYCHSVLEGSFLILGEIRSRP